MTRKSRRELERELDGLKNGDGGPPRQWMREVPERLWTDVEAACEWVLARSEECSAEARRMARFQLAWMGADTDERVAAIEQLRTECLA